MNKTFKWIKITLIAVLCLSLSLLFVACGEPGEKGDKGDKGDTGDAGVGIVSIAKDSTTGNVDIYKITMSNGSTTSFTVTNGTNGTNGADGKDGANGNDGISITNAQIVNGELVLSFSQGNPINLGKVVGTDGQQGTSLENVALDNDGNLSVTYGGTTYPLGNVKGNDGKSAYEIYKQYYDYAGTEQQWITDLVNGKLAIDEEKEIDHSKVLPEVLATLSNEMYKVKNAGMMETKDIFIGGDIKEKNNILYSSTFIEPFIASKQVEEGRTYQTSFNDFDFRFQIDYHKDKNSYYIYQTAYCRESNFQQIEGSVAVQIALDDNLKAIQVFAGATTDNFISLEKNSVLIDLLNKKAYAYNEYATQNAKKNYIADIKEYFYNWYANKGEITAIECEDYITKESWAFSINTTGNCYLIVNYNDASRGYYSSEECYYAGLGDTTIEITVIPMGESHFYGWSDGVKTATRTINTSELKGNFKNKLTLHAFAGYEDVLGFVLINNPEKIQVAYDYKYTYDDSGSAGWSSSFSKNESHYIDIYHETAIIDIYATDGVNNWVAKVEMPTNKEIVIINVPTDMELSDTYYDPNEPSQSWPGDSASGASGAC